MTETQSILFVIGYAAVLVLAIVVMLWITDRHLDGSRPKLRGEFGWECFRCHARGRGYLTAEGALGDCEQHRLHHQAVDAAAGIELIPVRPGRP